VASGLTSSAHGLKKKPTDGTPPLDVSGAEKANGEMWRISKQDLRAGKGEVKKAQGEKSIQGRGGGDKRGGRAQKD